MVAFIILTLEKGNCMRFRERLYRFMQGRYGPDQLSHRLLWGGVIMACFCIVMRMLGWFWPYLVFNILSYAFYFYALYRILSRNTTRRRKEYLRYLALKEKQARFWRLQKSKFKDRKTHVFRHCPHCKAALRLPRKRGGHGVKCPRCSNHFSVFILFGKKHKP